MKVLVIILFSLLSSACFTFEAKDGSGTWTCENIMKIEQVDYFTRLSLRQLGYWGVCIQPIPGTSEFTWRAVYIWEQL